MLRRQLIMAGKRFSQAGLSLVEMMVGIAVGLIVVAGASLMMTSQVTQNSRLLQETQIQQDLRAAADLMMRDLRRAGFSTNSANTVWAPGMAAPASNIYAPTSAWCVEWQPSAVCLLSKSWQYRRRAAGH